jgi:hypothetical protein
MAGLKHNPYVGSFHSKKLQTDIENSRVINDAKTNPMIGLFRHSPRGSCLGLKALAEPPKGKQIVSQLNLQRVSKVRPALKESFLNSLDQIPRAIFSSSHNKSQSSKTSAGNDLVSIGEVDCDCDKPICAICLEKYVDGDDLLTLACSHCYHSDCVSQWFYQDFLRKDDIDGTFRCPQCRQDHVELTEKESLACSEQTDVPKGPSLLYLGQSVMREAEYDFLSDLASDTSSLIVVSPQRACSATCSFSVESSYVDCGLL